MITVFTPSFADEEDANAQNLTVKEIAARLSPERFRLLMLYDKSPDARIAARPHTRLLRWRKRGNTPRILSDCLLRIPDVYFFPREGPLDATVFRLRKSLRLRTALVTYVVSGGLYNPEPVRPGLARNVCEADAVFANTHYLADLVRERLGREAGVRYDGVDRRFYFPSPTNTDDSAHDGATVLAAGSLRSYKRMHMVVEQAARFPGVEFRIAGQGEEEQRCRDLARRLGCDNVRFLGHLTARELGEEMRGSDIFFLPSVIEGHPQVLLQAAACGLPCLAMNLYRPEYVVDGHSGFLAADDDELIAKLELLIHKPQLRREMGKAAAAYARRFDWDAITREWEQAFIDVVASRRTR
jgi:glycosyltransferase involved in cell wall biosynthesis